MDLAIAASGDDGYSATGDTFNSTSILIAAGTTGGGDVLDAWLRFLNVTIPQGSTIKTAVLTLKAQAAGGTVTNIRTKIFGDDSDNATAPTTHQVHAAKVRTTAGVDWDPAEWTNLEVYDSPDITAVIQEIIDRPGWVSGNALQILLDDDGSIDNSNITGDSFDYLGGQEPRLVIELGNSAAAAAVSVAISATPYIIDAPTVNITAPTATITTTSGGEITISWDFTHATLPQYSYRILWKNSAETVTYYDSGIVVSADGSRVVDVSDIDVAGFGELVDSHLIVQVNIDPGNYQPTAAGTDTQVLTTEIGFPHMTITEPDEGDTITTNQVTVTWTYLDDRVAQVQGKYRIQVVRTGDQFEVYDSGWLVGTLGSHDVPVGLNHGTNYTVKGQVQNDLGVLSD